LLLACFVTIVLGGLLLVRRPGKGVRIVAVCELAVNGKACDSSAATPNPISPQRSPHTTQHLDRAASTKQFVPARATRVSGSVRLEDDGRVCTITYRVSGLTPGLHGFHIHESADFSNGCVSAGPHYNPFGKKHGGPNDAERHVGDLGNISADATGVAKGVVTSDLVKLSGPYTVVGRSMMVHADPDDLGKGDNSEPGPPPKNGKSSLVTGNAGARVACGEIKLAAS